MSKLCTKAKEILLSSTENIETLDYLMICGVDDEITKLTPIEQIFQIAFELYEYAYRKEHETKFTFYLNPQERISLKKDYIVDFLVTVDDFEEIDRFFEAENKEEFEHKNYEENVIVECDGHDYHKLTKQQVAKDNERDMDLKLNGYEMLRFSGSQLFNDPFDCAAQVHKYLLRKYGG